MPKRNSVFADIDICERFTGDVYKRQVEVDREISMDEFAKVVEDAGYTLVR